MSARSRGLSTATLQRIAVMQPLIRDRQPISVRGVAYQLFTLKLTPDMSRNTVAGVSRILTTAREHGYIPWEWIVDDTRTIEQRASWNDPTQFLAAAHAQYRKDLWEAQPHRVMVVSEKGTVAGLLRPVIQDYGIAFGVYHGFGSATAVHDLAELSSNDERPLTLIYVGDHDPSGRYMSDVDLPGRIDRYGGEATIVRVAITPEQIDEHGLPTFSAAEKKRDPRHDWFVGTHGEVCCELDALDPRQLRELVEREIEDCIDWNIWTQSSATEKAETESILAFLDSWQEMVAS